MDDLRWGGYAPTTPWLAFTESLSRWASFRQATQSSQFQTPLAPCVITSPVASTALTLLLAFAPQGRPGRARAAGRAWMGATTTTATSARHVAPGGPPLSRPPVGRGGGGGAVASLPVGARERRTAGSRGGGQRALPRPRHHACRPHLRGLLV